MTRQSSYIRCWLLNMADSGGEDSQIAPGDVRPFRVEPQSQEISREDKLKLKVRKQV